MLRTVIESPLFSSLRTDYLSEGEYHDFVTFLVYEPEAGALIPGSGGCRKIRWKMQEWKTLRCKSYLCSEKRFSYFTCDLLESS